MCKLRIAISKLLHLRRNFCPSSQVRVHVLSAFSEQVGAGDDIRIQSHSGRTPLFAACEAGGTQTVQVADWLCQMGAADDVRVRDANGRTPMHAACREVSDL
jgi:ankyrin repeat protein